MIRDISGFPLGESANDASSKKEEEHRDISSNDANRYARPTFILSEEHGNLQEVLWDSHVSRVLPNTAKKAHLHTQASPIN